MVLKTRRYTLLDGVAIPVRCAPISFILQVALRLLNAFVPAGTALFTASFVDTAVAIAQGQGTYMDIIIPSILLLATMGYEMLYTKLLTFVKLGLQNGIRLKYRTALLEKRTRLEYACIESSDDICFSRSCRDLHGSEYSQRFVDYRLLLVVDSRVHNGSSRTSGMACGS